MFLMENRWQELHLEAVQCMRKNECKAGHFHAKERKLIQPGRSFSLPFLFFLEDGAGSRSIELFNL